ncbi:MAG: PepSY-associated TM helix domain-containing protein [Pseudomonadota bacterium]
MKLRRVMFEFHSWLGLKLSILMTFILVTGTLAVFSYELDWLFNPQMRAFPPDNDAMVSWATLYDSAAAAYPDGTISAIRRSAKGTWWASQVTARTPSGNLARIWIDPYTGTYQGATGWFNIQRFLRQAHRHLMMPTNIGIPIVTILSFPLLIAIISGLMVYKQFWLGFLRWPRFDRAPRIWLGDLHRLGALWSIWFILVIALTGVWYLTERSLGGAAPRFPATDPVADRTEVLPAGFTGATLDDMVALAEAEVPGLRVRHIRLPTSVEGSFRIEGQTDVLLVRNRANAVTFDPTNQQIIGAYTGHDLTVHQRISEMADPLHFGTWGEGIWSGGWAGTLVRVLWFIFGVIMSGLSITGIYIYGLRVAHIPRRSKSLSLSSTTEVVDTTKGANA